ncbi:Phytochrome-like protein cph1 [Acaryochloris thomasi RCC1774]|uniref:histidine kinase n=1 Tax=Acaryochloris thomasi RCC1774 TaxID=1764569 RepID=A0A2W1JNS2_9CYAN|nr:PAS domain S-box protein [Acaryochloris thomasi]PZD74990.1 Phytochrome-like protein cph1 [Acaryochloris thomasi RCC1774]
MLDTSYSPSFFIPHGHCYLWKPELVGLHVISDALVAIAYFSIPCMLVYFVYQRKDLMYSRVFVLFGAFILACGTTHLLEIWTLWNPDYWISGFAKAVTAIISVMTAIQLLFVVPQALALKSPAELEKVNRALTFSMAERQRIEAELTDSQQLFQNAFDYAPIGKALVDLDGSWLKVNSALCELTGYSEAELLQTTFQAITHPEDLDKDLNYVQHMFLGEISRYEMEKRYFHKDGQVIWALLSVSTVYGPEGHPQYFVSQIQDITARKQYEADLQILNEDLEARIQERTADLEQTYIRLQESQAEYQDLYENAPDMYVSVDAESKKILRCNQTLTNALGYTKTEILDRRIFDVYHPACLPDVEVAFQQFVQTGRVQDAQLQLQRKDGSQMDVSLNVHAIRDQQGQVVQSRSSWRDITVRKQLERQLQQAKEDLENRVKERTQELLTANQLLQQEVQDRRQAEASLKQSQEQLELALEASGAAWWNWDIETGALNLSPQYFTMLGYTDQQGKGNYLTWENLVHPDDLPWVQNILAAHLKDASTPYAFDYRMLTESGAWKWIANLGKVVERDGQNQPSRMAGVHLDISDRKAVEEELHQLNHELSRSNQELGQFAYVASHDLQEPLRKIKSFTELLFKRYPGEGDEKAERYMNHIMDGTSRMQVLIRDLLTYSRVGRAELNVQPTDLNTILADIQSDLTHIITERQVQIESQPLPTLPADPSQMRQLFQNLVSNAIKYCQAEIPKIQIRAVQSDAIWTFSVQDNGIGIAPEYADRIFIIFQRLHNREAYSGTGIGLAVCKKIIERHGGKIWLSESSEPGATFMFTLSTQRKLDSHHQEVTLAAVEVSA